METKTSAGYRVHEQVTTLMREQRGLSYSEAMNVVLNIDPNNADLKREFGAGLNAAHHAQARGFHDVDRRNAEVCRRRLYNWFL
jgi:hypothetical protein